MGWIARAAHSPAVEQPDRHQTTGRPELWAN